MKVLFKVSNYTELEGKTIGEIYDELMAESTPLYLSDSGEQFLAEHRDAAITAFPYTEAVKTTVGTFLSSLGEYAVRGDEGEGVRGFTANDIEVRALTTKEYILGAANPEELVRFARGLQQSAKLDALYMLKNANVLNTVVNEKMLTLPVNTMGCASQAFAIMANEPCITMAQAIYSDFEYGGYMKCWPDEKELDAIISNPQAYAVAEIVFK